MKLELPEHLAATLAERDILLDLAAGMYASDHATLGQAAEVAGVSQAEFQRELGRRRIPVHFDMADLAHDLQAAAEIARS